MRIQAELALDMVNAGGSMHGGCSAYLVDICTSLALAAAGKPGTVSQAIDMVYHAPAPLGCRIRIVNLTITLGARISSARCEVCYASVTLIRIPVDMRIRSGIQTINA